MSAPSRMRIWGIGTSRTLRPHWMLSELGVEYETKKILPRTESMDDPEFLAISKRGKVPILEQDELVIGESGAMVFHLAEIYRDRLALAPEFGTSERAIFHDLCFFSLMELDAPLYVIRRHGGLPEVYGESDVAIRSAAAYVQRQMGEIERRLEDGRPYILGEDFSAADILLSTCLAWAEFVDIPLSDSCATYLERTTDRDGYRRAVQRNFPPEAQALLTGTSGSEDSN